MRLNPAQLVAQLARGLAGSYAVAGEEALLMLEALDAIRAAARAAGYSEREVFEADKSFEWQQLVDHCATGSLFAERRLVEVRLGATPSEDGARVLTQFATTPPADVLLVLSAGKLDARVRNGRWWSAFEQHGAALYVWPVRPEEFPKWLEARCRTAGLQPTADALATLVQRTEGNLLAAAQEVEKLRLLRPAGVLDADAVAEAVSDSAHFEVFDWLDRLLAGDAAGAVRGLQRLREEGEDVLPILGALSYDLRKLFAVSLAVAQGRAASGAAESVGVFKMRQGAFARAGSRARPAQVLRWLQQCAVIDRRVKTGAQAQAWEDLLTLTLSASGAAAGAQAPLRR